MKESEGKLVRSITHGVMDVKFSPVVLVEMSVMFLFKIIIVHTIVRCMMILPVMICPDPDLAW